MTMIRPTVGRVMWYRPGEHLNGAVQISKDQPFAAHVAYVHGDHMVNLLVIDHAGTVRACLSVPIVQDGSPHTAGPSPYAEWMPYQVGQAKKHEPDPTAAELGAAVRRGGLAGP